MPHSNDDKFNLKKEVRQKILDIIDRMDLSRETRLPSENELADQLQVSRITIRAVLSELAYEGRVFRRHGVGTFVNTYVKNASSQLTPGRQFKEIITELGYALRIELKKVGMVSAGDGVAAALGLQKGDKVIVTKKIFWADENLAVYCVNYVDSRFVEKEDIEILTSEQYSIYQILDQVAYRKKSVLAWDSTVLEATYNGRVDTLRQMMDKQAPKIIPYLVFKTVYYDQKDSPILYTNCFIDTSIIKYNQICSQVKDGERL